MGGSSSSYSRTVYYQPPQVRTQIVDLQTQIQIQKRAQQEQLQANQRQIEQRNREIAEINRINIENERQLQERRRQMEERRKQIEENNRQKKILQQILYQEEERKQKLKLNQDNLIDKVYWDDIVGLDAVKKVLRDDIEHKRYQNLHAFGPIGNGKKLISKALTTMEKIQYVSINSSEIIRMNNKEQIQNIAAAFEKARKIVPSVLFINNIDQLIVDTQSLQSRMIIGEIDIQIQGIRPEISGVMVIVASNDPDKLPQSIIRRFHHHMYFGVPNDNERATFFQKFLQKQAIYFQNSEIQQLVQATAGGRYSYSDLSHITDAFFNEDRSRINIQRILEIIRSTKPTVTQYDTQKCQRFLQQYGQLAN
ncbi:MAG: putative Vacuolar protein sorting-associated protein 4 [Streblomastix strix]|uniref:Putative Vacuolar protein sorting-associated protein 4 n=1 Tax=Streblomastix strix TaxID=222440 RepID=A0A5J4UND9_9EUKA|nr:MAG: putative Vacuolar protein sorting-associated protein 4 [Streblomastix strix]